jgi:4-hydroxy-tetrahydrodipicolinate reductase
MNAHSSAGARPIRLLVHGANGRMGQAVQRLAAGRGDVEIVAAVARTVGQRVVDGIPQYAASELGGAPAFDVAIDFSLPGGFDAVLALCVERGAALVSGTTGLDAPRKSAIAEAGRAIPVAWASNFSLGVAVLADLVARVARTLPQWECDIVELHHKAKLDAPSGTALTLGGIAASQGAEPRYASIRAGDIVGEHIVQFTGEGERIELVHRAGNRDIFARGALHAATRLAGRPAGVYGLADLID